MDKVFASPADAIADVPDGATVAFAGFGLIHRHPTSLLTALLEKGTKNLVLVGNSLGAPGDIRQQLVERRQVRKLIAAFSARPGLRSVTEELIASGELEVELVPQGTLVERARAAGAGIPAFYTPTAVGTAIGDGKEVRYFDGKPFVMEMALPVDFAFLRAHRGDHAGNLQFRGGSQNFNPSFAKAARIAIAEVDEILPTGELAPDQIDLPGILVDRVVKVTISPSIADLLAARQPRRAADAPRMYGGKPGLTREAVGKRAAQLLPEGSYVNLGTGMPTLVSNYLSGRDVTLHAENGVLGYGELVEGADVDPDVYNAGGQFVSLKPGAAFFDSVTSFEMARSGKLSAVILGAYQVDQDCNLANWTTPEQSGGGIGGAMDLVAGGAQLIIVMEHRDSRDRAKLVRRCEYPLTGQACVDVVITDLALLRRHNGRFVLEEVAPGFSPQDVLALTDMTDVQVAPTVGTMSA